MKRYIIILAAIVCSLCSCTKTATGILLDTAQMTLCVDETATIHASITPSDAANQKVYWTTSDSGIATVADGLVKAVAPGEAAITVTTDDGGFKASCKVTVKLERISVESILLDKSETELYEEECDTLKVTFNPSDATEQGLNWSSSNEKVAKVIDGIIIACKADTSTVVITASSIDGAKSAECKVKVNCKVKGVILDDVNISVNEGDTCTLKATVYPERATNKALTWSSSDTSVATVDANGLVTGVKAGTAIISAVTVDGGMKYDCTVVVRSPVSNLSISKSSIRLYEAETDTITATITPANASNQKINWTADKSGNVTIEALGNKCIVKAKSAGTAAVYATTAEGGFLETCQITVVKHVATVSLDQKSAKICIGETLALKEEVKPADAFDKTVEWTSSDTKVATVENGKVTAIAKGEADITVKTKDLGFTATCHITVESFVKSATIQDTLTLYKGEVFNIANTLMVEPEGASYSEVTWISNDNVSVSKEGVITAVNPGMARVIGKVKSGENTISTNACDIEVKAHLEGIQLEKQTLSIEQGQYFTLNYKLVPESADTPQVKWSTSDKSFVSISDQESGEFFARAEGKAYAILSTADGAFKDSCLVTVTSPIQISLPATMSVEMGKTVQLNATITPATSGIVLKWTSSDESIATVNPLTGLVTAKAMGDVNITVSTSNDQHSATCKVTVTDPSVKVKTITLNAAEKSLTPEATLQLAIQSINPSNATDKTVTWSTSDASVAAVNPTTGLVTAVAVGEATITATANDGGGAKATCKIKVILVPIQSISVTPSELTLKDNAAAKQLTVEILPANAGDKSIVWSSSKPEIATVDSTGKVTPVSEGETTILATSKSDSSIYGFCRVTVEDSSVKVTGVSLNNNSATLEKDETLSLNATVTPSNATNKKLTWTSSNDAVAKVDTTGLVTAVSAGSATITATSNNGLKATCSITVINQKVLVTGVNISQTEISLYIGEKYTLTASVQPYNATYNGITWETSIGGAVTCVNGVVTALKQGYANVYAVSEGVDSDGDHRKANCFVTVLKHAVDTVIIDGNSKKLKAGQTITMNANAYCNFEGNLITPSVTGVTWTSSDSSVASIDYRTGKLTANKIGKVTITATAVDYETNAIGIIQKKATCEVEVIDGTVSGGSTEGLDFKKLF